MELKNFVRLSAFVRLGIVIGILVPLSAIGAANKVVVIPMFDTKMVFTGVATTGNIKCSEYFGGAIGHWLETPCDEVDASLAGQDAELQTGMSAAPQDRYAINADGTVTDNVSGLIWLRNAFCSGVVAGNDWAGALSLVIELNTLGSMNGLNCGDTSNNGVHQSDWRLPNVKELQTIVDYGPADSPFVTDTFGTGQYSEADPFFGLRTDQAYWSSTSYGYVFDPDIGLSGKNLIDDAVRVGFDDGVTDGTSKDGLQHVWAVRSAN